MFTGAAAAQIRAKCCLYREAGQCAVAFRIYTRSDSERRAQQNETYEGAVVIDPIPGLYEYPTNTLDWASLYPSIMVTGNYCFSTLVARDYDLTRDPHIMRCDDPVRELSVEERERRAAAAVTTVESLVSKEPFAEAPAPDAPRFLKQAYVLGLVVRTQIKLLKWRKAVKRQMAAAFDNDDVELGTLLNQRQIAIKLLCNSIYGIFGSPISFMYCQHVSASVTARGRALLYKMRWISMDHFGAEVTNGDTDSIFTYMPMCATIEEAAAKGVEMADYITQQMQLDYCTESPEYNYLRLEFEKTFRRILLIAKKRYAGLKYEYAKGQLTAVPGDCVPTLSGLESKKRDVTLLVKEQITHVLSVLLDYHYTTDENMRRAREYVWSRMVRPLLANKIDLRMLSCTKALRDLPQQYAAKNPGKALPIHVQLAEKLIRRAGGEKAPNAPRAGDRLPFVVVQGEPDQPVSQRAEDPVYAFEHNVPIDGRYYLKAHVRASMLRIFQPVVLGRRQLRHIGDAAASVRQKGGVQLGRTEAERARHNEQEAAEFLFGHMTEYRDRFGSGESVVAVTELNERAAREKKIASGAVGVPPVRDWRTGRVLREPRYNERSAAPASAAAGEQRGGAPSAKRARGATMFAFAASGARCRLCRQFHKGASDGFVCEQCAADSAPQLRAQTMRDVRRYALDIEDLRVERAALAATCHECMGCGSAPRHITCENSECPVFWKRRRNESSRRALTTRVRAARDAALRVGALPHLSLAHASD